VDGDAAAFKLVIEVRDDGRDERMAKKWPMQGIFEGGSG
jgi:hypothetical protein